MEAGKLLEFALSLVGDVESGGVLSFGRSNPFWYGVFWSCLQPVEEQALLARFWRCEIVWHGLCGAWRRHVLYNVSYVLHSNPAFPGHSPAHSAI